MCNAFRMFMSCTFLRCGNRFDATDRERGDVVNEVLDFIVCEPASAREHGWFVASPESNRETLVHHAHVAVFCLTLVQFLASDLLD